VGLVLQLLLYLPCAGADISGLVEEAPSTATNILVERISRVWRETIVTVAASIDERLLARAVHPAHAAPLVLAPPPIVVALLSVAVSAMNRRGQC
jgi:hypothetical protein